MISTIHQRNLLEQFQQEKNLSLDALKNSFVKSKMMNQTTLYRILERFKSEGILHEIEVDKKRWFIYCDNSCENVGIKISYCQNCRDIHEDHYPLPENAARAETIEYLKCCRECE